MARILVTGAYGLLGSTLCPILREHGHEVLRHGRRAEAELGGDLAVPGVAPTLLDRASPDCVVNLAAVANVDACEVDPARAIRDNVNAVERLARAIVARTPRPQLVHVSSEQVYDGPGPHKEAAVKPRNAYGWSKYAGELAAALADAIVLRTNFFGVSRCADRRSFSDWVVTAARTGQPVRIFEDVLFSPLLLETLSENIARLVGRREAGVFNLGTSTGLSKAQFALSLAAALGLPTERMTISRSEEATLKAYRPKDMRMDSGMFCRTFGVALPTLESQVAEAARRYRDA